MSRPFLFVNKNANSSILSACHDERSTAIFRHVQKHARRHSISRRRPDVDSSKLIPSVVLDDIGSYEEAPFPSDRAETQEIDSSWPSIASTQENGDKDSIISSNAMTSNAFSKNDPDWMTDLDTRTWAAVVNHAPQYVIHQPRLDDTSLGGDQHNCFKIHRSIFYKDRAVDPFDSASIPISQGVHHLLIYFERLFCLPSSMAALSSQRLQSACSQVVKDCIFDEVQMRCIIAAMAARREYFDGAVIEVGSTKLYNRALTAVRSQLSASTAVSTRLIYSIMKLCHTEGYRHNLQAATVHLRAAQVALQQLNSWRDLDLEYCPTLCGSGHAFMVDGIWKNPASYPCLVDPGRAMSCFSQDLIVRFVLVDRFRDGTGQKLLAAIASSSGDLQKVASLQQLISDLIEYSAVKNNTLLLERGGLCSPKLVMQWVHLRRYALLSRLLSIEIIQNDFLHAIRVSIVFWLTIVANYQGYSQDLNGVASHLQDVMSQLLPLEERGHSELVMWMLMIGALVGGSQNVKPWFLLQLSTFSKSIERYAERSAKQWFICLEDICHETLYCEGIQRDSVVQVADHLALMLPCPEAPEDVN